MNFLVVIILSIVIISFSVFLLTSIVGKAGELSKMTQDDLDKKIENLQCSGNICFAVNYKMIERGGFHIFGLKIHSSEAGNFVVEINPVSRNELLYQPKQYDFILRGNDEARIGLGFEVPKNASSGIYIYNVDVTRNGQPYPPKQQIRIEVP